MRISQNTIKNLSKNEFVSMELALKICRGLNCGICDILEILSLKGKDENYGKQ